jgi:hypothetical protein
MASRQGKLKKNHESMVAMPGASGALRSSAHPVVEHGMRRWRRAHTCFCVAGETSTDPGEIEA